MQNNNELLVRAKSGDMSAFYDLFSNFSTQLKSYLYRLVANRNDMEDAAHDVYILAYENLNSFRGDASLKTWVFTIATNHARKILHNRKSWTPSTFDKTRDLFYADDELMNDLNKTHRSAPQGNYEIREHIDYCFTCVSKMLKLEQQIALILKDVYGFKVKEIEFIMNASHGKVKHLLHNARNKMIDIFDDTCALVSKKGVCNQCSGLNGRFNPKQNSQEELMKLKLISEKNREDKSKLYELRAELVKAIDPLNNTGTELHEVFMKVNHISNA